MVPSSNAAVAAPESTRPTCSTVQSGWRSVGPTCNDQRQPGSYVARPIVMPRTRTISNLPLSMVRISSGVSKRLRMISIISGSYLSLSSVRRCASQEQIAAAARILVCGEGLAIESCTKLEARASHVREYHVGIEEIARQLNRHVEPRLEVDRRTHRMIHARDVERHEERRVRAKDPCELARGDAELVGYKMDHRVEPRRRRSRTCPLRRSRA